MSPSDLDRTAILAALQGLLNKPVAVEFGAPSSKPPVVAQVIGLIEFVSQAPARHQLMRVEDGLRLPIWPTGDRSGDPVAVIVLPPDVRGEWAEDAQGRPMLLLNVGPLIVTIYELSPTDLVRSDERPPSGA